MIKPITTPGKTYAVTSPNGCTVTTDDGLTLAEVEAGKQGYFVAVSGKVLLSDEAAVLTQVFKLAPQQRLAILGVLGGGVPAWLAPLKAELTALLDGSKFELAWLAGEKKLVVHTDRISDELGDAVTALLERVLPQNIEVARYNHTFEISWRDLDPALPPELAGKYNECKNGAEMQAVDADYGNDLTEDGRFLYPIESMEYGFLSANDEYNVPGIFRGNKKLKKLWKNTTLKNLKKGGYAWTRENAMFELSGLEELPPSLTLENLKDGQHMFASTNIQTIPANVNLSKATNLASMFENCKKLRRCESTLNMQSVTRIGGMFTGTQFDGESACRILNNLPEKKLQLDIGIHVDHQHDEEVLEAIANAEAKGWTLTVRWNGTPTAQAATTYGLRKPPIYARVFEHERPDGTTERVLDWGHYVTDPTGYEEFRSVEAAREYFGLPDEDLTNN